MERGKEIMKNENICYCSKCGCEINIDEDGYYYDEDRDEYICDDCFDDYYIKCNDCGEVVDKEDAYYITDIGEYVCENCIDNYAQCEDCGDYVSDWRYVNNYGNVCENCYYNGNYGECDDCNEYYTMDDLHYHEGDDCYYCDNCYEDHEEYCGIYGYHDFSNWHFYSGKDEENAPYFIGKEIELDPKGVSGNLRGVLSAMNKHINAVGMHDGSLSYNGVEIVSHPESWKYLQEKKEDYRKFFEEIENLNYGDDGRCGLHFHVSRPNDDVISKIIVIIESFKDEIKKLSRRNGNWRWSAFLTDGNNKREKLKYRSIKYLKDTYTKENHDRYLALNLCNRNTIEFRFFNGVNNFEEFWGALEFIHNIMELALDDTKDVNTINWKDLLIGDELIAQAKKLGVYDINKYAKDTTDIMEKIEKSAEEMKKEIKKTLKNFIKYISKELEEKRLTFVKRNDIYEIERNSQEFLNSLSNDLNYLHRLTSLYGNIEDNNVESTKYYIETIKSYTRNMDKYSRYFKKIDNTIKKFESEEFE